MTKRACAANLTMPVPSKAVQQDGHLGEPSDYGYDAPTSFQKWALAGLFCDIRSAESVRLIACAIHGCNVDFFAAGSGAYTSLINTIASKGDDQKATGAKLASHSSKPLAAASVIFPLPPAGPSVDNPQGTESTSK